MKYAILFVLAFLLLLLGSLLAGAKAYLVWIILIFAFPLIFRISAKAAVAVVCAATVALLFVVLFGGFLYGRYDDSRRAAEQVAYQKSICIERVRLNADLSARGKPPLFPNLTLADCRM